MGLGIGISVLADLIVNDEEGAQWLRDEFAIVNDVLQANNLPLHLEPEDSIPDVSRSDCDSFPYSFLHHLRHAAAYHLERSDNFSNSSEMEEGQKRGFWSRLLFGSKKESNERSKPSLPVIISPLVEGESASTNQLVDKWSKADQHLLYHSDCEGMYVPIDFESVLVDERLAGQMLGSSCRLQKELAAMAPVLGIELMNGGLSDSEATRINDVGNSNAGLFRELIVWLALYEASRLSLLHKTAIVFG